MLYYVQQTFSTQLQTPHLQVLANVLMYCHDIPKSGWLSNSDILQFQQCQYFKSKFNKKSFCYV